MRIKRISDNKIISDLCIVADSMLARMTGLLLHSSLQENESMFIKKCNSVHTFFMRFAIDVLFLSKDNRIVHIVHAMKPWRATMPYFAATAVLEMPAGSTKKWNLKAGDQLLLCDTPSE